MLKMGKIYKSFLVLSLLLSFLVLSSVPTFAAEGKIALKQYPDLKIGFTTAQFLKFLPTTVPNVKQLIDFAAAEGLPFDGGAGGEQTSFHQLDGSHEGQEKTADVLEQDRSFDQRGIARHRRFSDPARRNL